MDTPPEPHRHALGAWLCIALLTLTAAVAAQQPTPRASALIIDQDEEGILAIGYGDPVAGTSDRIGVVFTCEHATGTLTAYLYFGAFPHAPVQAAARSPNGTIERFGDVVNGNPNAGFHNPKLEDPADARRLLALAFQNGTLLSNGYNSIWNALPAKTNESAHTRLTQCAAGA